MTDRLQAIRERWEAATPGPWESRSFDESQGVVLPDKVDGRQPLIAIVSIGDMRPDGAGNMAAIASAPDDIAYLLRLVEAGDALAEGAEGNLSATVDGRPWAEHDCMCFNDNICPAHFMEQALAAWRQVREGG